MTRVTDYNLSQAMLSHLSIANERLARTERQISSGKNYTHFDELAGQTDVLLGTKRLVARTEGYQMATKEVTNALELNANTLSGFEQTAQQLRNDLFQAMAVNDGYVLMQQVEGAFDQMVNIMNVQSDGKYLYGGTLNDRQPVTITDLDDLGAAASAADAFRGNTLKKSVPVDQNVSIQTDFLASEVAQSFFAAIKSIKDFNDGVAAFSGPLTVAQEAELQTQINALDAALNTLRDQMAFNGNNQRYIDDIKLNHEAGMITLKRIVSDIEDVDLAEAVVRLNQDQMQAEAAMRVIGQLSQLSLMDFLPLR